MEDDAEVFEEVSLNRILGLANQNRLGFDRLGQDFGGRWRPNFGLRNLQSDVGLWNCLAFGIWTKASRR